jgi:hypothetical protein
VIPPAAFSPEQIPQDRPAIFFVPGNAGDLLIAEVKEVTNPESERTLPHTVADTAESRYSISVRPPTANGPSAKILQEGGDCTNTSLFLLPETGTYQLVLDASSGHKWGRKYGISFSLLGKDDPVVDPGIKPEQIMIDFGGFGKQQQIRVDPPVLAEGCLNDSAPAHVTLLGRMVFRIMQVAGYKKAFPSDKGIATLEAALTGGKTDSVEDLPYSSSGDAGLNMWARPEVLVGDGWRGLRWIGGYGQEPACRPHLRYVFQGITNDGRFLIVSTTGISHPATQKRWAKSCTTDANTRTEAAADAKAREINTLLESDLAAADPASFQPSLDQLDAVVRSLHLATNR